MTRSVRFRPLRSAREICALLLLFMFAVLSMLLVAVGIRDFSLVSSRAQEHAGARDGLNYVINRIRAADGLARIEMRGDKQNAVLVLSYRDGDAWYETRIFCLDGMLWEQYARPETPVGEQGSEPIVTAQAFRVTSGDIWEFQIQADEDTVYTQYAALRSGEE